MTGTTRPKRVLLYSHDSYGLGHVSRCRTIANAIVDADHSLSVLIVSGSPVIGSYEFRSGIDFVRVPGMVKQLNGEYDSANLRVGVEHTLEMRTRIIRDTADIYRPDLFIVDKEPLGLRGEVVPTLELLKSRGVPLVMGLRDVMDDPAQLAVEWDRKNVVPALRDLYDEIWVYGLPHLCNPMSGIDLPRSVTHKTVYTGYLRRDLPQHADDIPPELDEGHGPFILVTTGGGGDGEELIDWVLRAYESDFNIPYGAVIVFGPFMSANARDAFRERAAKFRHIRTLTFTNNLGLLMDRAAGVVSMGGYNTFCEILSFDKRAIIVPRTRPRQEQLIRAESARDAGLVEMLDPELGRDAQVMATALRQLPQQGLPSDAIVPGLLDGLPNVCRLVARAFTHPHRGPAALDAAPAAEPAAEVDANAVAARARF
ncbi:MAG TPA: glycosyltransferase [Reyranellaceae bacterium]|nr:glycosyltransferase [Reyranellaceae bacterium]